MANRNDLSETLKINLQPISKTLFEKGEIVSNSVIVGEVMSQMQRHRSVIGWFLLIIASIGSFLIAKTDYIIDFNHGYRPNAVPEVYEFVFTSDHMGLFFWNVGIVFLAYVCASTIFRRFASGETNWKKALLATRNTWLFALISAVITAFLLTNGWIIWILLAWWPISMIAMASFLDSSGSQSNVIQHTITLYKRGWFKTFIVTLALGFMGMMVLIFFRRIFDQASIRFSPGVLTR